MTIRPLGVAFVFAVMACGCGGGPAAPVQPAVAMPKPAEPPAAVKAPPPEPVEPPKSEEELIQEAVKTLKATLTPAERMAGIGAPQRMPQRQGPRQKPQQGVPQTRNPAAASQKPYEKAFEGMAVLSTLDKQKAGAALKKAFDEDGGRYFLLLAMGRVGGEPSLSVLRKVASIWSEELTADPDDAEALTAAALLFRNGIPEPFQKAMKAFEKAEAQEEYLGKESSAHYYARAKLNAVAGRKEEALADLGKVRRLRVMGATPQQAARQEPDFHDLWDDPAFDSLTAQWQAVRMVPDRRGGPPVPAPGGGYLGMQPGVIEKEDRADHGMKPNEKGVLVEGVTEGGPADKGGLKEQDVILAVNGEPVYDPQDLTNKISSYKADEEVTISILRNKERQELKIALGKRPSQQQMEQQPQKEE